MYEIIIKKTVLRKTTKREYGIIEKRPYTDEELSEANRYWRDDKEMAKQIKDVMGYRQPSEVEEKEERTIYRQEVDELDLEVVIMAVNKIAAAVGK